MSYPTVPFETQNKQDDDGAVIDSFFIETDNAPDLTPATEPIDPSPKDNPPRYGRLLTGSLSLTSSFTVPTMILPADANRQHLLLASKTNGPAATMVQISATGTVVAGPAYLKSVELASTNGAVSGVGLLEVRDGVGGTVLLSLRVAQDQSTEWVSGNPDGIKFTTGIHATLSGTGPGNLATFVYTTAIGDADYVIISDENGKATGNNGYHLRDKSPLTLDDYTGALWAYTPTTLTGPIEITWTAVTK